MTPEQEDRKARYDRLTVLDPRLADLEGEARTVRGDDRRWVEIKRKVRAVVGHHREIPGEPGYELVADGGHTTGRDLLAAEGRRVRIREAMVGRMDPSARFVHGELGTEAAYRTAYFHLVDVAGV